jgi:hypothetical protein
MKSRTTVVVLVTFVLIVAAVATIEFLPTVTSPGKKNVSSSEGTSNSTTVSSEQSSSPSTTVNESTIPGIFSFQPPTLSGGDAPISLADFATHSGQTNEWMEAKLIINSDNIWYIHANETNGTSATSGDVVNISTDSDPNSWPQGSASYNVQTHLMTFTVKSVPPHVTEPNAGGAGSYHNAKVGDVIECYPFSTSAFWATGSVWYAAGNCRVITDGETYYGPGYFDKHWGAGGNGIGGAPLPTCGEGQQNFESDTTIVTPINAIYIVELDCPGTPNYQVGGVLWFSNGAWEDTGTTEGRAATSELPLPPYTPDPSSACNTFNIIVPTTRGTINATIGFNVYYYGGCSFEDGWLSGSIVLGDETYPVLGVHMEFRCAQGYC